MIQHSFLLIKYKSFLKKSIFYSDRKLINTLTYDFVFAVVV